MRMKCPVIKMTARSVRSSFGRYAALLLIVALSVGFFAGLKLTKPDMHKTLDVYAESTNMYDFRLISTLGFDGESEEAFAAMDGVAAAEGVKTTDALIDFEGNVQPYKLMSVTERVNTPSLKAGRLPERADECAADANIFTEDDIGKKLTLSGDNASDTLDTLAEREYTVVGLVESPLYLGTERGSTTLSGGSLEGFICILPDAFESEAYTEIYLRLEQSERVYSDEYSALIDEFEDSVAEECEAQAAARYERLLAENGLTEDTASYAGIEKPDSYVLTRSEDEGYVGFENDTSIVSGIANVFPVFFILVAMLVCVTTMSRMVFEERTQIGVLKAIGFSDAAIAGKYLLYAGSATLLGWAAGYFLGAWGIPLVFWEAYGSIYDFAELSYRFDAKIMFGTLAVALVGTLGSTLYACRRTLGGKPAELLRPKTPKGGRRILLERVKFIWRRLPFLQKVSIRNMFLSKKRLLMMLIGISGCTALLVTGFGVRDSLLPTGALQYGTVQKYDLTASFTVSAEEIEPLLDDTDGVDAYILSSAGRMDAVSGGEKEAVRVLSFEGGDTDDYFTFESNGAALAFPKEGEALLSRQAAEKLNLSIGDSFILRDSDMNETSCTLSGIFDNYIDNFAILPSGALDDFEPSEALILSDAAAATADRLLKTEGISGVTLTSDKKASMDNSVSCLNYIIFLIILFAGALAFVVIYNLTNINLSERSREVATVKVLGFRPRETNDYVLRENLLLSVLAALIGLPLGAALHRFVLYMIDVDGLSFPVRIEAQSYLYAFLLTVLFASVVNLYMRRRVDRINMAESLKTVE